MQRSPYLWGIAAALTLGCIAGLSAGAAENNVIRPGEPWPDNHGVHINAHGGGVLYHAGTYYWFGEHKTAGPSGNLANVGVGVYASTDLIHWRDEGIALPVSDDPGSDLTRGCILERPKVIFNAATGKFVMWFHLEPKGGGYRGARSGVAIADQPTGPFRFLASIRPNAGAWPRNAPPDQQRPLSPAESALVASLDLKGGPVPGFPVDLIFRRDFAGGQMARDMNLFVDDDGQAYQIYASEDNGTLQISRLSADYLRPAGDYARILPGGFNEAPALFKHGGKYWLITSGCTGWAPNPARLAVADSIWGPWTTLGNPWNGPGAQTATSYDSQSTFVLPIAGAPDAFIFMADRWRPDDAQDGRYVWVPVRFQLDGVPFLEWKQTWDPTAIHAPLPPINHSP